MSAVVGYLALDGQPARADLLQRMLDTLAHRGPDGRAIWHRGPVGLGHCMLHTTPESHGDLLPLERNGLVITADARIDNRGDLIHALGMTGERSGQQSDSAIILAAYEKWGEGCVAKLLGDFSFSIWDDTSHSLFCARDHFGGRPLYYCHAPDRFFAFASEIKALLCVPGVSRRLNESRIGDYLAAIPSDKVETFYEQVARLQSAHSVTVGRGGLRFRQYWAINPNDELRLRSRQEYAEAYLDIFRKAVACRMRTGHPVGSALSGGLDSSSIVCIARDLLRQRGVTPLPTFSGVFDEVRASDERPYIASVVAQGGIAPHYVVADRISPLANFNQVLWHLEEPVWTPNLYMHWGLYERAKAQGVRVFLDGFLGDNVLGHGWEHLMDLAYSWRWTQLYRELRAVSKRRRGFALPGMAWRYFADCSVGARLGEAFRQGSRGTMRNATSGDPGHPLVVHPELARRINLSARLRARQAAQPKPPQAARKRLLNDLTAGEIQLGLETANKSASAFQLEDRYPFTDRRLVEFSMATPPDQRIEGGLSRMILRRAFSGILPEKVRQRSGKGDLSFALQRSLLKFEEPLLDDLLLSEPNNIEEYVDLPVVRRSYLEYKKHRASDNFYGLWAAINVALWRQQRIPEAVA